MQALIDALERETDPVRRRNLEVVARHVTCEVAGDIAGILATLVAEPVYRIWGASTSRGPQGGAGDAPEPLEAALAGARCAARAPSTVAATAAPIA